jgi:DNA-binding NtrC family response regulator
MDDKFNIMIVEDEQKIAQMIEENLIKWRYDVFSVKDFQKGGDSCGKARKSMALQERSDEAPWRSPAESVHRSRNQQSYYHH